MKNPRKLFVCLGLSLLSLLSVGQALAQAGQSRNQGPPWWKNERYQRELALTPDQSSRIEGVFKAASPTLRAQKRVLDKLEDELSRMIAEARVEEAEVEQFVARVEAARADLSKTRTLMLFRMHRILSAEQNLKLQKLFEQAEKDRHGRNKGQGHQ